MKVAMAPLAVLAIVAGALQIPGVTDTLEHFLEPTFEDSRYVDEHPSDGAEWIGPAIGGVIAHRSASRVAYFVYIAPPRLRRALRERFARVHTLPREQVVLRRALSTRCSSGRRRRRAASAARVIESAFVQGVLVGGAGRRRARGHRRSRARSRPATCAPTRCCCSSASAALALYFLIVSTSTLTIHLSHRPLPAARRRAARGASCRPRLGALGGARAAASAVLAYAVAMIVDFDSRRRRAAVRDRRRVDRRARHPLLARRRRAEPVPDRADGAAVGAVRRSWACVRARGTGRGSSSSTWRSRETAVLGAFMAQDLALFVVFFDLMLVPFYFLIGGWGRATACAATTKFVIYTLVGSLLMLAGAVALGVLSAPERRRDLVLARRPRSSARSARARRTGSSCCSRSRSSSRRRCSRSTAGCRTTYRATPIPVLVAAVGACCRRSASTASCGSCCRSCPTPRCTSRS